MKKATTWTFLAMSGLLFGACRDATSSVGPDPSVAQAAAALGGSGGQYETLCVRHPDLDPRNFANTAEIAQNYVQVAFTELNSCLIDTYFYADSAIDQTAGYQKYQLVPWLARFFGCPGTVPLFLDPSDFGLVPRANPPYSITANDFAGIATEFLRTVGSVGVVQNSEGVKTCQCSFGFTTEEVAEMNLMLYQLAPFVINDHNPGDGLTHSDCADYHQAYNVAVACTTSAITDPSLPYQTPCVAP